jgi:hypothetical protein
VTGRASGMDGDPARASREGRIAALLRVRRVPTRRRLMVSILLGCVAGLMTARESARVPGPRDFGQVWFAARSILDGVDPYPLVGPGLTYDWASPLVYPLTAALVAVPFAPFLEPVASMLFAAVGGAFLAWALMEYGYGPLFGFFAYAVREAAAAAQWSPLFSASLIIAPLSLLLIAKPTIGAVLFFARPRGFAVVGAVVLSAVAFGVQPTWVTDWLEAVQRYERQGAPHQPYRAILSFPGGFLPLLCLARWRRPEARLLAAHVCVPITLMAYETVPLLLIPRTFWESAVLVGLSYTQHHLTVMLTPVPWTHEAMTAISGQLFLLLLYLPATIIVLRRPNVGPAPRWLELRATRLPEWLRGAPDSCATPSP